MSDTAAFPLTTKITISGKTPVGRRCPACYFQNFCTLPRKFYPRTMLCIYLKIFYFELLDPEILSGLHNFLNTYQ